VICGNDQEQLEGGEESGVQVGLWRTGENDKRDVEVSVAELSKQPW
jgi:hypothetical protein